MKPVEDGWDDKWSDDWGSGGTLSSGFQPSDEDAEFGGNAKDNPKKKGKSGRFRVKKRNGFYPLLKNLPFLKYAVLFVIAAALIVLIVLNWPVVLRFLRCILIGGIAGMALFSFIALKGGQISEKTIAHGAITGAIVGCILQYNLLGVGSGLIEILTIVIFIYFLYDWMKKILLP